MNPDKFSAFVDWRTIWRFWYDLYFTNLTIVVCNWNI